MSSAIRALAGCVLWSVALRCGAGVIVITNVSPGATSWPGSPVLNTVANPSTTSVSESFDGGGGNTNLSQTFSITTTNYQLQTIDLYGGGSSGTVSGTNLVLRLFDLGIQTAPNPSPYNGSIIGTNLFGSGAGLAISYFGQVAGVLEFDFTGADQVILTNGHMYVFELTGVIGTIPLYWQRGTTDTYPGGAAYRNQVWINGGNARDFALALYGVAVPNPPPPSLINGQCTVDWNEVHQRIDGFGGGVQFLNPGTLDPVNDAIMNTLFGTANATQLGLTILRIGISPDGNWANELSDGKKAVARGAGVLATPWTPPAAMKDNGNIVGGALLPAQYTNYANYLNGFAAFMASNGAPLRAISIQNEPDVTVTYDSCDWTADQLQTFCHNVAGLITNAPVMMPESYHYDKSMSDPTLNDPVAAANVDIVGLHLYGNGDAGVTVTDYPNAHNNGKPTWMTEFLVNDQTIGTAITTAQQVHDCLTVGNMSAFIWWKALGDVNGLVNAAGVPQKRGFVLAQWSRFVHTNYYRLGVINNASAAATSAYKDPAGNGFAIVAVNTNSSASVNQTFNLSNFTATAVTPWVTSGSQSLAVQSPVTVSNAAFVYVLPPQSVVTFVGQRQVVASNTPPALTAVPDRTINAGVALAITNTATDSDVPAQTLTFTLLNGPTNATLTILNASNAVFNWRPLVSQANTTNLIAVKVADNGTPVLSATNQFTVKVNALAPASLISIIATGEQANLVITGPAGPDYTLSASTNLVNWWTLFVTNSPPIPFTLVDTNLHDAARFYRIQLRP